jgi:GDP-4-dehydro-6-deoxy-D-mannose reductase
MKVLITGGGFVGQWVARTLLDRGDRVDVAAPGERVTAPLLSPEERAALGWIAADFRLSADVDAAVERSRPDVILHLAGVAFPPDANRSPELAYDVNTLGAVRLLGAVQTRRAAGIIDPVIVIVGTGVQYGRHDDSEMPLVESADLRPPTSYAASKAAQEIAAVQCFLETGVRVICTRSFNHSGVGHAGQYLIPSLVKRVRGIARGDVAKLSLGNDVVRDYLHVSDVVSAYLLLAEHGAPGEVYNVASGHGISARELAAEVLKRAGATAEISTDASLTRSSDIPTLIGSPAKLQRQTGWTPRKSHADIIDDLLNAATD